jgi:transcriptional regulator of acetoin/glycerol metabolism
LEKKRTLFGRTLKLRFEEAARTHLIRYAYPGNVREMENVVENLYVFAGEHVTLEALPDRLRNTEREAPESWKAGEKAHLTRVYQRYQRNKTHTSQAIGYSLNTLKKKLREYGIEEEQG